MTGISSKVVILSVAALALAACGSTASPSSSAVGSPSTAGSPSAAAGSPSGAVGSPSAAVSPLPAGEEGAICADLSATLITDGQPDVQGVQSIYHISEAQVIQAVKDKCPSLSQDMPAS
jgi:hypothetical protein